ncbi:MAG: nucleotidyltransferase family protein [Nonlabens sp.]
MNYKELVLLIGKMLSLSHKDEHKNEIESLISNDDIDWEKVVQLSTKHYVLPAIYCNLKKVGLLEKLPDDLVKFMTHITDLNRERNQKIKAQCDELHKILSDHGISFTYVKGSAMILQNLFQDPAERMIGDIDLLLGKKDLQKAFEILQKGGYIEMGKDEILMPTERHLPRLVNDKYEAAVEIHSDVLRHPFNKQLSGEDILFRSFRESGKTFPHLNDQLILSIAASQVNDYAYEKGSFNLRSIYDGFILRQKGAVLSNDKNDLLKIVSDYLEFSDYALGIYHKIEVEDSDYLKYMKRILSDDVFRKGERHKQDQKLYFTTRLLIISRLFRSKAYRIWLWKRIKNIF